MDDARRTDEYTLPIMLNLLSEVLWRIFTAVIWQPEAKSHKPDMRIFTMK